MTFTSCNAAPGAVGGDQRSWLTTFPVARIYIDILVPCAIFFPLVSNSHLPLNREVLPRIHICKVILPSNSLLSVQSGLDFSSDKPNRHTAMASTSNTQRPPAPVRGPTAPSATPTPAKPNPFINPSLPTDIPLLRKNTFIRPAPNAAAICNPHKPNPQTLPTLSLPAPPPGTKYPPPNPALVHLIIPTANKDKANLLINHVQQALKPDSGVTIAGHTKVPADSGVGEQPYDTAGPRGAFNRVVGAVRKLCADDEFRAGLARRGVGTVLVASVENFMAREAVPEDGGKVRAVDYGAVVFCRISLVVEKAPWVWRVGASRGVTAPVEYWKAAEAFGFEDRGREHGKVTVGVLLAANIPGLDKADWHKLLADVSRYELLGEAMKARGAEVPWPAVEGVARAGGTPVGNGGASAGASRGSRGGVGRGGAGRGGTSGRGDGHGIRRGRGGGRGSASVGNVSQS